MAEQGAVGSNLGLWNRWYDGAESRAYGDEHTYRLGAKWLFDCATVEDWGAGLAWFKNYLPVNAGACVYTAVDGSHSKYADKIVDLTTYTSSVEGIYMRHVLEHNYEWEKILRNALQSFTKRMCLVLFTPMTLETCEITFAPDPGVPDLSFSHDELLGIMLEYGVVVSGEVYEPSATQYGVENVFYLESDV